MKCPICGISILEHPANECLNAWVAEKVMGYMRLHFFGKDSWGERSYDDKFPSCDCFTQVPSLDYSVDIAAAWKVVERIKERNWWNDYGCDIFIEYWDTDEWLVCNRNFFSRKDDCLPTFFATAPTVPLAICRAAILAAMSK